MFTLNGGAIVWRSVKQSCIFYSTMEAEYVASSEVDKEVVWLYNFLRDLEVITNLEKPMVVYCDNSGTVAKNKEPRSHQRGKHIEMKFHLIRDIMQLEDVTMCNIKSEDNLVDHFMKTLSSRVFKGHVEGLRIRDMSRLL